MPHIDETTIATKVHGVTRNNRQSILKDIHEQPERVKLVYRKGLAIFILLDGGANLEIGYLDDKYQQTLQDKITKIQAWKITGGYLLSHTDGQYRNNLRANFGLNLTIKIVGEWDKEKSE